MFIGYGQNSAAYRLFVVKSDHNVIEVNTIVETKNADFFEGFFLMKVTVELVPGSMLESESNDNLKVELRRSKRARKETNLGDGFYTFLVDNDPQTYSEAITAPDAPFWKEAIKNELESIMSNHVLELVDIPPGAKTLGCKWIFKKKLKSDRSIDKHKALLYI
ncbi:unnamed protein product [Prunus armeniaca]